MDLILTNFNSDRKCLVNMSNYETAYVVWDKEIGQYKTKICFKGNESFVFVEESLQTIHKLIMSYSCGMFQSSEWETKSIDDHMERFLEPRTLLTYTEFNNTNF